MATAQPRGTPREQARLLKELADIQQLQRAHDAEPAATHSTSHGVSAQIVGGDIHRWRGFIAGPLGTPYEGGHFTLDIVIPPDYPYNPPKMKLWTETFAKEAQDSHEDKVRKLTEMGFAEDQVREALRRHDWDETLALNSLVEG